MKMKTTGLLVGLLGISGALSAAEPKNVINTVDVSGGGVVATPVALHRDTYAAWLADPDYNSWTNYTPTARVHYEYPQVVRLVAGAGGEECFLTNLCPGTTYPYSLKNADGERVSGSFTTASAAPRWILSVIRPHATDPSYVANFRDLGGWEIPGGNGRRTNFNVFFRSAGLDDFFIGSRDYRPNNTIRTELGIRTELDLRGDSDVVTLNGGGAIEDESYYYPDTVENIQIPTGPANAFTNAPSVLAANGPVRYFRVAMVISPALDKTGAAEVRKAFHVLGTKAYHPVLFHCQGGRDRTGFVAMLIEALCGLSEEQLYRDHLSIVFAAQKAMYAERLDGNIRQLYVTLNKRGQPRYARYGESLAGHVRAYLEDVGVTAGEIATITDAYVGETPDEVLTRVNAYEAAKRMRTVTYVTRELGTTNAVHRVGDGDFIHEPLIALDSHYAKYNMVRDDYRLTGWTDETAVGAGQTERYSLWEEKSDPSRYLGDWFDARISLYGQWPADAALAVGGAWSAGATALDKAATLCQAGRLAVDTDGALDFTALESRQPRDASDKVVVESEIGFEAYEAEDLPPVDPEWKGGVVLALEAGEPVFFGLAKTGTTNGWVRLTGPSDAVDPLAGPVRLRLTYRVREGTKYITYSIAGQDYSRNDTTEIEIVSSGAVGAVTYLGNGDICSLQGSAAKPQRGMSVLLH